MARLLVVDNDPDILDLLRIGLESLGYQVRTADSGLAALRAIEEEIPDILITDLIMPNISGEKLLKIIHAVPEWADLKTIVISGVAAEAPELRKAVPCDIYIAKGPIASTLKYLQDSITHFEQMRTICEKGRVVGADEIHSRHITRELIDFKAETDKILDHITDGICRVDTSRTVIWMNVAFSNLLERPEELILGRDLETFLHPKTRQNFDSLLENQETLAVEVEVPLASGGTRLVRARRISAPPRGDCCTTLLWQDVTDRLLSEEYYENIVESTSSLICTTDQEGFINYVSRSCRRMIGRSPQEMLGRKPWDYVADSHRDQAREQFSEILAEFLAGETPETNLWEVPVVLPNGTEIIGEVHASPFRNRANRIMGIQLALTDITARRHLEDERQALLHEVQHRVRDNLQLVASLVRISHPLHVDTRIAAVSEVFDELYLEQSFSRIKARPLLERIICLGLTTPEYRVTADVSYHVEAEFLPMRSAVPLSLIITEIMERLIPERTRRIAITVSLVAREEQLVLTITGSCPADELSSPAGGSTNSMTWHEGCPDMLEVLASQLRGTCQENTLPEGLGFTVAFAEDLLVS
ncbi:PAS domain S-box-containing protein [Alkalispirochaeta americana]|uniref:PAS domain S-box-containing protein n=1 Tax=Alkalispirochaeta americana TaxID=159291 RepID=A0A1N6N8K9_9SPIO|nr:PAS domain-containing protein [Alkalispirochaeta americana]SIP88434.1 PAS domain S-box-containing protein [Alkalispirochaeta americana]